MSLASTVAAAVEAAFAAAGDLVATVTWKKQTFGAYDVATGARAVSTVDKPVRAIEDEIKQADAKRLDLSSRAVKLIIPAADFTAEPAMADPVLGDKLVHRGTTYTAKECKFEGTKAVWEIHADV